MRSGLQPRIPSPLPQEESGRAAQPVRVVDAFYQFLPPKSLSFFKRTYSVRSPRPLIPAITVAPAFPRKLPIARIKIPPQQVLVFQDVVFTAYRNTNIDPLDYVPLSPLENKRLLGFVGYGFTVGDRAFFNANTNVGSLADSSGVPGSAGGGGEFGQATLNSVISGSSAIIPYQGSLAEGTRGFAAYGRPGQTIEASAVFIRLPPFEVERFTVDFSGYLMTEAHFDKVLSKIE
jgi:hypothetical protein